MYLATEPGVPYEEPPFHPPSIPVHPEHQDKMLYLYITNYLINSGFYAAANDGRLSLSFSNDNASTKQVTYVYRFPGQATDYKHSHYVVETDTQF